MKKLLLGICYSFIAIPLFAQQSFQIVDKSSLEPLPGATVTFENETGIVANSKGIIYYHGKPVNALISCVGYKSTTAFLNNNLSVIALQKESLFLQPVEIKAIRAGDNSPFTKTNISKKEITKTNLGQDLPFLLNLTPAVVVNADAGNGVGYTGIRIRGTDASRINVTLNGIPYNDPESQGVFFVNLPDFASSVNSIQIQRGVGTSSNGAGAFGATLNIGTNEYNANAYGEINNSAGSFNTWKHTVKLGSGLIDNHFTIDARLSKISSDGYVDRASSDLRSYYLSAAYLNKKSSLRFNVFSGKEKTYQAWYGIPTSFLESCRTCNIAGTEKPGSPYNNETDNYQQDHYQLFFNQELNKQLTFNVAGFYTRGLGYYEQYKAAVSFSDYGLNDITIGDSTITHTDIIRQLWLDNHFYGGNFSVQYKKNKTQLTLGGGYNQYEGAHYGRIIWAAVGVPDDYEWYRHNALKTDLNIYAKWQYQLSEHFEGFADMQYRGINYTIDGFRNNPGIIVNEKYAFFNPKAGISYHNQRWNAYASFSVGNKEPNRDDFEAGLLQQPKPETLYDTELGVEYKTANWAAGVTLYHMNYYNQLVLTGKINDVGAYTRTNIPRSYRMGIELQATKKWNEWLSLSGNIALSDNKIKDFTEYIDNYDDGTQKLNQYASSTIAFSPAMVAAASLNIIPFKNTAIVLPFKYVSRQYLDNTANKERSLNAFFVQDLRLSYTLKKKIFKETNFIFQLNNVFNRKYEPNGYTFSYIYGQQQFTENYVFPMAGISWMLGIHINL